MSIASEAHKALIRRTSPRLAEGLVTHIERSEVDMALAERQWQGYVDALGAAGWETIEVEPAPDCPDSVFIEDAVVVYGRTAVVTRPGADERKPEVEAAERAARTLLSNPIIEDVVAVRADESEGASE